MLCRRMATLLAWRGLKINLRRARSMRVQQVKKKICFVSLMDYDPELSSITRYVESGVRRTTVAARTFSHVSVQGRHSIAKRILPLGTTGGYSRTSGLGGIDRWWKPQNMVARASVARSHPAAVAVP